jgi:NAD(P)-dependent dehydrogenase (short-subunit alcohol dehydrogenase family)
MPDLSDRIALVTGASRGAGAAIAAALGEAGATVYLTGRSSRTGARTDGMPGTVEDAAEAVTARGGTGIAVVCDQTSPEQVDALVARIGAGHGRLDVLVNNAWGGYERGDGSSFAAPFWEQPLAARWDGMFGAGVWPTMLTSHRAAPLLADGALVACTIAWAFGAYTGNAIYDAAKACIARFAFAMAQDLRERGVTAVAIAPGWMRTERVLAAQAVDGFDLSPTESPEYVGRAVAHLAADPARLARSGSILTAGELAREYGFTDVDGSQPEAFRLPSAAPGGDSPPGH